MNDSYPKDHPGCLSKAREVLRQAMRDTDVQDVTFLEFQEEVTQALDCCAFVGSVRPVLQCMHAVFGLCVSALLSLAACGALRPSPHEVSRRVMQHALGLPLGCTGHPSVAVHEVMAEHLTGAVRNITGW